MRLVRRPRVISFGSIADDVILESDRKKFLELKRSLDPSVDSVTMHYHLGKDKNGLVTSSLRRNRLVKRSRNFKWVGAVHEYLEVNGSIFNSDIAITHCKIHQVCSRNLRIYERRLAKKETFSPRDIYYYANELMDHANHVEAIKYYQKFLETKQGWIEDNISACGKLADCYLALNNPDKHLRIIYQSFDYDTPRAELCCRLGFYFLQTNQLKQAIFWYKIATELEEPEDCWGILQRECWTWLPHLQLCVCYDRIGNHYLAYKHNEIAAEFVPDNHHILHNRKYLETIIEKH